MLNEDSETLAPRSFKLTLQYDGSDFHGWQRQKGLRTAQGTLDEALTCLLSSTVEVDGASRTDAGVHAVGQVASFECVHAIPTERITRALNGTLPADLRVVETRIVAADFHARFSAVGKHYRYVVDRRPIASPFDGRYSVHLPEDLDVEAMRQAATKLVGQHDFASFQCATDQAPASSVREIRAVDLTESEGLLAIHVWGQSFLYKMVRTIAGTLLDVGRGNQSADGVAAALAACDRRAAGPTAPAHGLTLIRVYYEANEFAADCRDASSTAYRNNACRKVV